MKTIGFWQGVLFLSLLFSCNRNSDIEHVDYYFYHSFGTNAKYTIDFEQKTLTQIVPKNRYSLAVTNSDDTNFIAFDEKYTIDNYLIQRYFNSTPSLDSSIRHTKAMLDGYGFLINIFKNNGDSTSIGNNINERGEKYSVDFKYLDAFFELASKYIDTDEGKSILNYNRYFYEPCSLSLKRIIGSPKEFHLKGSYCGNKKDSQSLVNFINRYKSGEPVILKCEHQSYYNILGVVLSENAASRNFYCYGNSDALYYRKIVSKFEIDSFYGNFINEKRRILHKRFERDFLYYKNLNCHFRSREEIIEHLRLKN